MAEPDIEREKKEIADAPVVQLGPIVGRCGLCGRVARTLHLIERMPDGRERYAGDCCVGPR